MKIANEGLFFILPLFFLTIVSFLASLWPLAVIFAFLGLCLGFFFRDPKRQIPENKSLILSPADGKIIKIEEDIRHPLLLSSAASVSIFLSLFNVHFVRSPLSGTIREIERSKGKFLPAYKEEASERNKSLTLEIKGEKTDLVLKLMVGIVARRIKCFVRKDEKIEKGQKIGLIYLGSRIDLFVPNHLQLKIFPNQKTKAGETIIAETKNEEKE